MLSNLLPKAQSDGVYFFHDVLLGSVPVFVCLFCAMETHDNSFVCAGKPKNRHPKLKA